MGYEDEVVPEYQGDLELASEDADDDDDDDDDEDEEDEDDDGEATIVGQIVVGFVSSW